MSSRTRQHGTDTSAKGHIFINRAFGLLWSGQTISTLGSHITDAGIPLIAILVLGAQPVQVGLLVAFSALPSLLFGLLIGVWVDRLARRPLMLLTDIMRALLLFSLPIAALSGHLHMAQLYLVAILLSCCTIGFNTAYQAFLPQIIASDQLIAGNSKLGISSSLAEIGGPPLAGTLIQLLGAPLAMLFDGLSFLFSALSIALLHPHEIQRIVPAQQRKGSIWREMHEGFAALFSHPLLRTLAIYSTVRTFFGGAFAALYIIYIVRELRIAPAYYGILIALGGIGALLGSFIMPALTRRFGPKRTLIGGALLHGLLAPLTPLVSGPMALMFAILGISQLIGDIGFELYALNEISLRQINLPVSVQGRVNAVIGFLVDGVAPLGTLLAGIISQYIGVRMTLLYGASGMLLIAVWLALLWHAGQAHSSGKKSSTN